MNESLSNRDVVIAAWKEEAKDLDTRRASAQEISNKIAQAERRGTKSACGPVPILVEPSDAGDVVIVPDSFHPPVLKYGMSSPVNSNGAQTSAKGAGSTSDQKNQNQKI